MSLLYKRRLDRKKPKKFRVVILLWEVEPELRFHRGKLTSASHFIKVRKRFEKEFDLYSQALSIFNFLHEKLRSYWWEKIGEKSR